MSLLLLFLTAGATPPATVDPLPPQGTTVRLRNQWRQREASKRTSLAEQLQQIKPLAFGDNKGGRGAAVEILAAEAAERAEAARLEAERKAKAEAARLAAEQAAQAKADAARLKAEQDRKDAETSPAPPKDKPKPLLDSATFTTDYSATIDPLALARMEAQIAADAIAAAIEAERLRLLRIAAMDDLDLMMMG